VVCSWNGKSGRDFRVRAIGTTADIHIRTLKAKEREFKAFLDVLIKAYPHIILLLRQQREGKRTIPTDKSTGDPLRALHDGSGGECHDEGDNEVAKVPALVCAMSQRLSAVRGDIQRYVKEVQHEEEKYCELGSRLFCATSDGSDVILVNALFGLIPLLLDSVDSSNIVEGEDRHESGIVSGKGRKTYVFPATTTWPPTVPPTTLDTDICESSLGFRSSILPFWNGGRWQVAVFRSAETRVLIDPWGLDDSRGLHVGKTSWDAF
jgi:hypothetical protein